MLVPSSRISLTVTAWDVSNSHVTNQENSMKLYLLHKNFNSNKNDGPLVHVSGHEMDAQYPTLLTY